MRGIASVAALLLAGAGEAQLPQLGQYLGADRQPRPIIGVTLLNPDGTVAAPGGGGSYATSQNTFIATGSGTGYAVNDLLSRTLVVNPATGAVVSAYWGNITQGTVIAAPAANAFATFNSTEATLAKLAATVQAAGTSSTTAQGVQGTTGGLPVAVAQNGNSATSRNLYTTNNFDQIAGAAIPVGAGSTTANTPRFRPADDSLGSATLPATYGGRAETFKLAASNTPSAAATLFGGDYIFTQVCSAYGSVNVQVLGPDGSTYATVVSYTTADTNGHGMTFGGAAKVQVTLGSGSTACNATLSRVPG